MKKTITDKKKAQEESKEAVKKEAKPFISAANIHLIRLIIFLICILIFVSLYGYSSQDPLLKSPFSSQVELDNYIGAIGAFISGWLVYFFGIYSYLAPVFILALTFNLLFKYIVTSFRKFVGFFLLAFILFPLATYYEWHVLEIIGGGYLGAFIYQSALTYLNTLGSLILFYSFIPLAIECFFPRIIAKTLNIFYLAYAKSIGRLFEKKKDKQKTLAISENKDNSKDFEDDFNADFDDDFNNDFDNNEDEYLYDDFYKEDEDDKKDNYYYDDDDDLDSESEKKQEKKESSFSFFGFMKKKEKSDEDKPFALPKKESSFSFKKKNHTIDPFDRPYDTDEYVEYDEYDEYVEYDEYDNFDSSYNDDITDLDESYIAQESDSKPSRAARTKLYASPKARKKRPTLRNLHLPTTRLLLSSSDTEIKVDQKELDAKGALLIRVLKNYGIIASLVRITTGPVITMFEVRPSAGTKISKITALGKELALNLKATSIRFQAPVLGSDTVGIELPSAHRATVSFKEVLDSKEFKDSTSLLSLALGKNISGQPVSLSLAKMPHLLVAGATGMGKSVCLNSIILSLLYKAKPHEVKLLLIDPKVVEFGIYEGLPHLVHPVVMNMEEAKHALAWAVNEMERRYKLISDLGARGLDSYNKIISDSKEELPIKKQQLFSQEELDENLYHEKLPYIVIMIDELSDLLMEFGKEVQTPIARLGQKARAAGIHMILATQRPSVDVVTSLIKANLPTRFALGVVSPFDSKTILGEYGAESLLGKGDMLVRSEGGRIQRLHGAFVPDADVAKIIDFWKKQQEPDYKFDLSEMAEDVNHSFGHESNNSDRDVLFDKAAAFAPTMKKFSVCGLQRHLNIGFNRASNLRDQLIREGVIHLD